MTAEQSVMRRQTIAIHAFKAKPPKSAQVNICIHCNKAIYLKVIVLALTPYLEKHEWYHIDTEDRRCDLVAEPATQTLKVEK